MSRFDLESIERGLDTYIVGKSADANEFWDEIGSTNARAIELANSGAEEGVIVLARAQSGGRGRQGRTWVSPPDSGLYMSVLLRPKFSQTYIPLLSFAAGVAVCEAVQKVLKVRVGLKWVNDIVYQSKKLGGILAEMPARTATSSGRSKSGEALDPAVIVGVGINLSLADSELPDELKGKVASLDALYGAQVDANQIASEFFNSLEVQYNHLRHAAAEFVLLEWKRHNETLGKRIKANLGQESIEGTATDLNESGALILKMDDGQERLLHAGEISIRLADGTYA